MDPDPMDPGQGAGGEGVGATGIPPADDVAAIKRHNVELEAENAKLRAERRRDRAAALVDQHGLTARQALEIASKTTLEEIEEAAAKFGEANRAAGAGQQPSPPATAPPGPAPGQPPNVDALRAMDGGEDGGQVTPPSLSWVEQMNQEVQNAQSLEEVVRIQDKYKQLQRERDQAQG